jgi:hypothetical protein
LAVFILLPVLQWQCEIACADDDGRAEIAVASQVRPSMSEPAASLGAPDDCVGHVAPAPMLASERAGHRPGLVPLATGDQHSEFVAIIRSTIPSAEAAPTGGPPPSLDLPLRI